MKDVKWWFEPNLGSTETPATITTSLCTGSSSPYSCGSTLPAVSDIGAQRFVKDGVGGGTYVLIIAGANIPTSTNTSYATGQKRKVYWAYYYEDTLRDDANGPDCCDEIDMDYATCCAQTGSTCPGSCP